MPDGITNRKRAPIRRVYPDGGRAQVTANRSHSSNVAGLTIKKSRRKRDYYFCLYSFIFCQVSRQDLYQKDRYAHTPLLFLLLFRSS
jgi:hypothetical protein